MKIYGNVEVTEMGSNKRSKWNVSADRILVASARGEWLASSMEVSVGKYTCVGENMELVSVPLYLNSCMNSYK